MKHSPFQSGLLALILILYCCWVFNLFVPTENLISSVPDDAFYYLQVVDNIVNGFGSTFDGINTTNGYHPLWTLVLIFLRSIFSSVDNGLFVRIVLAFQSILTLISILLLRDILSKYLDVFALLAGLALFSIPLFRPIRGLETAIVIVAMSTTIWLIMKQKHVFWISVTIAILFLARLDYVIMSICLGLSWVWTQYDGQIKPVKILMNLIKVFTISIIAGISYMLINQLLFGIPYPITFLIKTLGDVDFNLRRYTVYLGRGMFAPILIVFFVFGSYTLLTSKGDRYFSRDLWKVSLALVGGSIAHMLYMILNVTFAPASWHFVPHGVSYAIATCIMFYVIMTSFKTNIANVILWIGIVGIISFSAFMNMRMIVSIISPSPDNARLQLYRTAVWIDENTPPDSVIVMKDAGILAYFGNRTVINLDGLVNDLDVVETMAVTDICQLVNDVWMPDYYASILSGTNQQGYIETSFLIPPWSRTTEFTVFETDELFRAKATGNWNIGVWTYTADMCASSPGHL